MPDVGNLVPAAGVGWMTMPPKRCPNWHELGPGRVLVGHVACTSHQGGHTTWTCRECDETVYGPTADPLCSFLDGPAAVRNSFRSSRS